MADLNELKPVGRLNPFAKICCTSANLPTSYMISLTYEEQLLWLSKKTDEIITFINDILEQKLADYIEERNGITPVEGHTNALFLSLQNKRITVRAVENLVKKYSKLVTNVKKITPHKLRSTYGTTLYQETGDIYLVADVLGHKDVNTTRKHYAALEEDRRRRAGRVVKLRDV